MKDAKEEHDVTQQKDPEWWLTDEEYLKSTEIRDDIEEETEWER